jgi:hypothetical protein
MNQFSRLPPKVSECLVSLSHAVSILTLLHSGATILDCIEKLIRKAI